MRELTEGTMGEATGNKEPWLAVILSQIFPGAGQIYSGRIARGCIVLCISVALWAVAIWSIFSPGGSLRGCVAIYTCAVLFNIWILFDAHKCSRKVNSSDFEAARKQSRDPWLAVFLSYLLPGLGHLYIRKWLVGIMLLICFGALLVLGGVWFLVYIGLYAVFEAFVCWRCYVSAPVRRETSRKIITIVVAVVLVLSLQKYLAFPFKEYIVEAYSIPTSGMAPTLAPGDKFLVKKFGQNHLRRGAIIVFKSPRNPDVPWAQRLVAFPRESVEIRRGGIYIDGEKLDTAPFAKMSYISTGQFATSGEPYTVPPNSFFVLGDNSANSFDSRFWGALPKSNVNGHAYKIYWPLKRIGALR